MIDHLAWLGYGIREDIEGSRVMLADRSVLFSGLAPDEVRRALNDAMDTVIPHFTAHVSVSRIAIEARQIEEAALRVVLSWLSLYALWRSAYPEHRHHPLVVGPDELRQQRTFGVCRDYGKAVFGADYRQYVAALLGLTEGQYARMERRLEAFENLF